VVRRRLIVNADDFGQSAGINEGIAAAFDRGIVTSASLMVRWPGAEQAAAIACARPALGVGLHLDLGEWTRDGADWRPRYEVVPLDDPEALRSEALRQLARFEALTGSRPTHLDSHQHVHRREPVRAVVRDLASRLGVPLRHFAPGIRYCGDFYGQSDDGVTHPEWIAADRLVALVRGLPAGTTELCCHPANACEATTMYAGERLLELSALCDPAVRAAIDACGVRLCAFGQAPVAD
jgi:chitin disaccharide deacetylase